MLKFYFLAAHVVDPNFSHAIFLHVLLRNPVVYCSSGTACLSEIRE